MAGRPRLGYLAIRRTLKVCKVLHRVGDKLRCLKIRFTVSLPRRIQNLSLTVFNVAFIPECLTRSWVRLTRRLTKACLACKRIGKLVDICNEELPIRPLHLTVWSSLRNKPNRIIRIGGVAWPCLRLRKDSSSTNSELCIVLTR